MTELFATQAPPGTELLIRWLTPLGAPVRAERRPGDPLPFRTVVRLTGHNDKITDTGIYSVHDFGVDFTAAEDGARLSERRMLALGPPWTWQQPVILSDGTARVDSVITEQSPHPEFYSDTVWRFVARYEVQIRFVTAP